MCIDSKLTGNQKTEWLEDTPKTFTVYKAVEQKGDGYYPIFFPGTKPFHSSRNVLGCEQRTKRSINIADEKTWERVDYFPYYHFFLNEEDCRQFIIRCCGVDASVCVVLKCRMYKRDVTDVGYQSRRMVVVATGFTILEEI